MRFERNVFQFALCLFKKNLESTLNFERAPLKLQRAIKEKGGRGGEGRKWKEGKAR